MMNAAIRFTCALAALATFAVVAASGAEVPPYEITARISAGGEGGWDYISFDPGSRHLFIGRGSHLMIVDAAGDSVVGDVPNTPGVHGATVATEFGHGFTSNGRDSSVTVFDLKTFATLATIKLPARNPDAILYDAVSKRVFTFNAGSASVTAIDPASNRIVGSVTLDAGPEAAVADGHGRVFVNIEDKSEVVCFDARTLKVLSKWPLAPGEGPSGIALDLVHHRLFSACANKKLIVLDATNGKRVADLAIGERVDGAAFDPGLQRVVTSNGEGTLSVYHEDSPDAYTHLGDVPTQRGARTVTLDPATHRVYTCTAQYGETPAPTAEQPRPRPKLVPGSFVILAMDAKTGR